MNSNSWFSPTLCANGGHLDLPPLSSSLLQVAIFIAHKDHERSLSSAGPVLNMKKLHSHFCALLKQLLSYACEKSLFLSPQSSHTKPHFPFIGRKKLIALEHPESFLSSVCLPAQKSKGQAF